MHGLVTAFREGGWLMYVVGALGVLATTAALVSLVAAFTSKVRQPALAIGMVALVLGLAVPAVGVVGYVIAMGRVSAAVAGADPASRATLMAQGISEAMNVSAFGIVCGLVPCAIGLVGVIRAALRPRVA